MIQILQKLLDLIVNILFTQGSKLVIVFFFSACEYIFAIILKEGFINGAILQ